MWNWIGNIFPIAVFGGAVGSLVTTWLSASLQHRNWRHQRRAELSLTTIHDLERICAEFITCDQGPKKREPPEDFNFRLEIARGQLQVLFSKKALDRYQELQTLILTGTGSKYGPHDFDRMREALLLVLYTEIGVTRP